MIPNPADGSVAERVSTGSARRRRERRLRSMLRHERMSVAMALAAATHHSAQRGEWRDLHEAPRGQRTASAEATYDALRSQTTSVAGDTEFFSLYEEELGGTRPDRLFEVRPQGRGTSGTPWNRLSTPCSSPRRLMFLCRRWITNWWRCAGSSMCVFPSRSSKCPRSHLQPVLAGAVCASLSRRQNSWWKYRRSSPILLYSGLWSRTSTFQFLVVEGEHVGLQGFLPRLRSTALHASQERSSERIVEQIVDSRVLSGGSSASSSSSREHAGERVFSTFFPGEKSAKVGPHSSPRVPASVSPSTSSAQLEGFFIDENDDVWMRLPSGQWMLLGSDQHVLRDEPG